MTELIERGILKQREVMKNSFCNLASTLHITGFDYEDESSVE
jgi:hypothetical protein